MDTNNEKNIQNLVDGFMFWADKHDLSVDLYANTLDVFSVVKKQAPELVDRLGEVRTQIGIAVFLYEREKRLSSLKENKAEQEALRQMQGVAKFMKDYPQIAKAMVESSDLRNRLNNQNNQVEENRRSSIGR